MPSPKVFISSTCYDLGVIRSQLRNFVINLGYEPLMSDYGDILYDPRSHTHTSCIKEVENSDMLILIIGTRFGGKAVPKSIEEVDIESLKTISAGTRLFENKNELSITQLEVLKAIETGIPIFTFIENSIYHSHGLYEKNKDKDFIREILFPSVDKPETAKYIFEFINFLRLRSENNSITPFSKLDEIENHLRKQWSHLFQRFLYEMKTTTQEEKKIDYLSQQIADIKTAILTSITSEDLKKTALGAIQYRSLIDFIYEISMNDSTILKERVDWNELLTKMNVVEFKSTPQGLSSNRNTFILLGDNTFFETRISQRIIKEYERKWGVFKDFNPETKDAIINAVLAENNRMGFRIIRHVNVPFEAYFDDENMNGNEKIRNNASMEAILFGDINKK